MDIALWIFIYIISVILSWVMIRAWLKFSDMDGSLIFILIMIAPVFNIFAPIMFLGFLITDWLMSKEIKIKINYNKFFRL